MAIVSFDAHVADSLVDPKVKWGAILKIVSLFGFAVVLGIFALVRGVFGGKINQVTISDSFGKLEYKVPYKNTLYESFGFVQEPKVTVPLKTTSGYENTTFLLDSGAVVSTLPLQAAQDTGVDLARAKRITLQGFSGVPAFAYLDKITIRIGEQDFEFPATFTESSATTYILGRKGLFDDFTINFDHEERVITISKGARTMNENVYERIHRTLSWKRIAGFNLVLLLVLVIPLSVRLAQIDTENRSGAAGELEPSPIIPPPNYPTVPPRVERVSAFFGKTGDTVVVIGSNFGDYQWGSRVFVGSVEAKAEGIIRWSDRILEVKIPEGARTGRVGVNINGVTADWEGNFIVSDTVRATQIGIQKVSPTQGKVFIKNGAGVVRGMVELGHVSEPVNVTSGEGVRVTNQVSGADNLGKKMLISFEADVTLPSTQATILELSYPGIGVIEIVRAELYDVGGKLISIFSDPITSKLIP